MLSAQGTHLHSVDKIFIGRAPHSFAFQFSFAHGVANGWRHAAVRLAAKLAAYRIATASFARTFRQGHALPSPRAFAEVAKGRAPRQTCGRHKLPRLFLVARFGRSPFRSRSHWRKPNQTSAQTTRAALASGPWPIRRRRRTRRLGQKRSRPQQRIGDEQRCDARQSPCGNRCERDQRRDKRHEPDREA